jgi:hypothetical protein
MNKYEAIPAVRSEEPLLLGMIGPPGGGKTVSSLRIAAGIQSVRGGDIVLIDTEGGRSRRYSDQFKFKIVEFTDAKSSEFLACIRTQVLAGAAAIIVDSLSDEHENYLAWHDAEIKGAGGNSWAAWAKPKADRKLLLSGILKIKTPLIFTFRAREKTKQDGKAIVNIGWQPVAPLEIVHTLDLTCILPPRADGVPVWKSDKIGEDFIIKLPNYLAPFIEAGTPLNEQMGAAFARWAQGGTAAPVSQPVTGAADNSEIPTAAEYIHRWTILLNNATPANTDAGKTVADAWNADKAVHKQIDWPDGAYQALKLKVLKAIEFLKEAKS